MPRCVGSVPYCGFPQPSGGQVSPAEHPLLQSRIFHVSSDMKKHKILLSGFMHIYRKKSLPFQTVTGKEKELRSVKGMASHRSYTIQYSVGLQPQAKQSSCLQHILVLDPNSAQVNIKSTMTVTIPASQILYTRYLGCLPILIISYSSYYKPAH